MTKEITFTLPAEALGEATEVLLLGDFNSWNAEKGIALQKQEDGSYKATAQLETGKTYQYRYLLNDGRWVNDYQAQGYVPASGFDIDNCLITVSETPDTEEKPVPETKTIKPKTVRPKTPKPEAVKVKTPKVKSEKDKTAKTAADKASKEKTATGKAATGKSGAGKAEKKK